MNVSSKEEQEERDNLQGSWNSTFGSSSFQPRPFMSSALYWSSSAVEDDDNSRLIPWVVPIAIFSSYARPLQIAPIPQSQPSMPIPQHEDLQPASEEECRVSRPCGRNKHPKRAVSRSGILLAEDNHCQLCRSNREAEQVYLGHLLRDEDGKISCPILRRLVCRICGATGDVAHTLKYCPFQNVAHVPPKYRNANFDKARSAAAKILGIETVPALDDDELSHAEMDPQPETTSSSSGMCSGSLSSGDKQVTSSQTQTDPPEFEDQDFDPELYFPIECQDAIVQTLDEDEIP